jgi:uncharacterized protein YpmB
LRNKTLLIIGIVIVVVIVVVVLVGLMGTGAIPSPFNSAATPTLQPLPSDQYAVTPPAAS